MKDTLHAKPEIIATGIDALLLQSALTSESDLALHGTIKRDNSTLIIKGQRRRMDTQRIGEMQEEMKGPETELRDYSSSNEQTEDVT